jgi:tRNA (cmo5U34)-methyltransferase
MNENKKTDLFDSEIANEYETRIKKSVPGYDDFFDMAASFLLNELPENGDILVVGAGGGKEIEHFSDANRNWKFTGIDPSAEMTAIANEKIKRNKFNATMHHGYIENLKTDTLYDAATLILVLHFINTDKEKLAILKNISSRLKKGALFIIAAVCKEKDPDEDLYFQKSREMFMTRKGLDPEENEERKKKFADFVHPITEDKTEKLLAEAGFGGIKGFYRGLSFSGWVARKV